MSEHGELERLTARLDRERRARREAELIAERGLRELWRVNRDLDARVAERTAHLERELAALALIHELSVADVTGGPDVSDRSAWIAATGQIPWTPADPSPVAPVTVADQVLARWQRLLARSGHLLSIDVDPSMPPARVRWDALLGAVDLVLVGIHRRHRGGRVTVAVRERPADDPPSLELTIVLVPSGDDVHDELLAGDLVSLVTAAAELIARADGRLGQPPSGDDLRIELCVPIVPVTDDDGDGDGDDRGV